MNDNLRLELSLFVAQLVAQSRSTEFVQFVEKVEKGCSHAELNYLAMNAWTLGLHTTAARLYWTLYSREKTIFHLFNYANCLIPILSINTAVKIYHEILNSHPNIFPVWRNLLMALEYSDQFCDYDRLNLAVKFGQIQKISSIESVRTIQKKVSTSKKIGYLSGDFCNHTVGRLAYPLIEGHTNAFQVFCYYTGNVVDDFTKRIQDKTAFFFVKDYTDEAIRSLILSHDLDVLVDLSGYTANSRVNIMVDRIAVLQMSWLGYTATTGIRNIDFVILDKNLAEGIHQDEFTEAIDSSLKCRWIFSPPSFTPEVAEPPFLKNGYVTFGCCNNTSKYNEAVLLAWAQILNSCPSSKLSLKWKSFSDDEFIKKVRSFFQKKGIAPDRVLFFKQSSHLELLKHYSQIDIMLDTFPFNGGITTCESILMGVPVLSFPGVRVSGRQSVSILKILELNEYICLDRWDYISKAVYLAYNPLRLVKDRVRLRGLLYKSPLCDQRSFVENFERLINDRLREGYTLRNFDA